ncbi:MAG TPA: hypothetical protein VJZ76_15655 [Thermoanaerobaculia bacterium]|nr:hypothetical protein [Thermoanaerobaculia bacterium]
MIFLLATVLWTAHPSDGVTMKLARDGAVNRVNFDFRGHGGYAIARREVNLDLPPNYEFIFRIRADAPPENLEFKLISGDNVWWLNRRDFVFPRDWTTLTTKKRKIEFAWGPSRDPLRHVDAIEVVVTAGSGGKGTVWFTDPELEALPPSPTDAVRTPNVVDFGAKRELAGLEIVPPAKVRVFLDDVEQHPQKTDRFVWLPDAEARTIRVEGANEIIVEPPGWAETANDFWSIVAKHAPRGEYPRYLLGEQPYWTIVGADGAEAEALVGEDGNVEPFKGGESIEPFLIVGGKRLTWADVEITQSLEDGYLPIPSVTWRAKGATMTMTAAVSASSMLQLRYRVHGAELHLDVRPFQVNPSTQFLNAPGGVARVKHALPRMRDFELDIPLAKGAKRQSFEQIARDWREKLNRVRIDIAGAPEIANTIRSSLAYTLILRDGAAIKPGSRSYDRAWIRDGALLGAMLLRLGHGAEAKAFARWFAKYQYEDGKVPCCVDQRGADPVPENDSHGEFIYLVREIERLTGERMLQSHVDAAAHYIEKLRTYEGLVTESISHEGYSAKPVHSYWDDFFAIQGVPAIQRDLLVSMNKVIAEHHLDYVPASVELADFDPTSTAIGISPLGVQLPPLRRTYARYFAETAKPREDWTPYEMRIIGAMVRLGDRAHALELIERFLADRRPAAWNQWAEVVGREYRKPRFIGDMPHAWVASDFVRSILEAIAYDREDGALVVGAGVPAAWLPLHVGPLPTYQGPVDIRIDRDGVVELEGAAKNLVIAPPFRSARQRGAPAPDRP